MKLAEIISVIESHAPLALQESYDNAGLAVGDTAMEVQSALLCIDVTEKVIEEAIQTRSKPDYFPSPGHFSSS